MNSKKVIAIQGSFRPNGITTAMLKYAVDRATALGHDVTYINLHERDIKFCKGCRKCFDNFGCIFKDDIEEITELVKQADVIILSTPVYWANVPAIVKNLFDRLNGAAMEETKGYPKPRMVGKRCIILTACNTVSPFSYLAGQIPGVKRVIKEFFKTAGVKYIGTVVCCNTGKLKEVPRRKYRKIDRLIGRI